MRNESEREREREKAHTNESVGNELREKVTAQTGLREREKDRLEREQCKNRENESRRER